jgi:hypothetical protein
MAKRAATFLSAFASQYNTVFFEYNFSNDSLSVVFYFCNELSLAMMQARGALEKRVFF